MSTTVMALCWPIRMPPTQKAVLISLADQANDHGCCWPSVATICVRTCFGERAVRNAVRWLEEQGLLAVEAGRKRSNVYTLALHRIRAICEAQARVNANVQQQEVGAGDDTFEATAEAFEALLQSVTPTRAPAAPSARKPAPRAAHRQQMPHAVTGTTCRQPAPDAGQTGTTCPLTVREPIQEIHPQPPEGAEEPGSDELDEVAVSARPGSDAKTDAVSNPDSVETEQASRLKPLIALGTFLAICKANGEKPIPEGHPIFAYCDEAKIGREILQLHWREFKTRRTAQGKRQRDWRQTFFNSVRDNWYRLWYLAPGEPARLTTQGLQAQAVADAQERAQHWTQAGAAE